MSRSSVVRYTDDDGGDDDEDGNDGRSRVQASCLAYKGDSTVDG